jgi:hypothetical protein
MSGFNGAAAEASRGKVRNINNFGERCCGNFFRAGTIWPPMALIFGKKPGKIRPVAQKNRGILITWSMRLFLEMAGSARPTKFRPVLDFSPRGQGRRPISFQRNNNLADF